MGIREHPSKVAVSRAPGRDRDAFLGAMSQTASGVYIVSTNGAAGRYATTVSAFSSASADPPLVLVCINSRNLACVAIEANRHFCISALSADQAGVSQTFAGRPASGLPHDFSVAEWYQGVIPSERLKGAIAHFDCRLERTLSLGSHTVFVGEVVAADSADGEPLLYARRGYHAICAIGDSDQGEAS